jgi:hypothetical protein
MEVLLAGCGLSSVPQPVPAVLSQHHDPRAAPPRVVDRMTRAAPAYILIFNSHTLPAHEQSTRKSLLLFRKSCMISLT